MTLLAIMLGVSTLIISGGFVKDIYVQLGEAIISSQTGHAQVTRKGYHEQGTRQPERFLIESPADLADSISTLPNVSRVSARLSFSGLLNNGNRDFAIIGEGVEPSLHATAGTYMEITSGRHLTESDAQGILLGEGVSRLLALHPGDYVTLVANTMDGMLNTEDFEVVGVFRSFSKDFDARAIRIPLQSAQNLLMTNGANTLVISLDRTTSTDNALREIQGLIDPENLEIRNWRELSDFYDKTVELYDTQFGVLKLIILFMVLLSVANSVNMSTFERMAEFGTLAALGNRRSAIFRLIVAENIVLGLMGATLGVLVGIALALLISAIGIPMPPPPNANVGYTAYIRIVPEISIMAFTIGVLATLLASLLPARRISVIPIVEALRQG